MIYQTLKELLKPPFIYGGDYKWDWDTYHIRADIDGEETAVLKVMPIADHDYYKNMMGKENYEKFLKMFSDFAAAAMNEKWERDFGEPMRWIKKKSLGIDWIDCPKCKHGLQEGTKDLNYCSHCGQRLLLPKEMINERRN